MFVVIAYASIIHFNQAQTTSHSVAMSAIASNSQLHGTKLYDVTSSFLMTCGAQCGVEVTCQYIAYSSGRCTLYSTGSTVYNVSGMAVYQVVSQ
jgi:hypothetical protein